MSKKNPLAEITLEYGLIECSMGRCCNARIIKELKEKNDYYFKINIHGKDKYYYMMNDKPHIWDKTKKGTVLCETIIDVDRLKRKVVLSIADALREINND